VRYRVESAFNKRITLIFVLTGTLLVLPHALMYAFDLYLLKVDEKFIVDQGVIYETLLFIFICIGLFVLPLRGVHNPVNRDEILLALFRRKSFIVLLVGMTFVVMVANVIGLNEKGSDDKIGYVSIIFPAGIPLLFSYVAYRITGSWFYVALLALNIFFSLYTGSKAVLAKIFMLELFLIAGSHKIIRAKDVVKLFVLLGAAVLFFFSIVFYRNNINISDFGIMSSDKWIKILSTLFRRVTWFDGLLIDGNHLRSLTLGVDQYLMMADKFIPGVLTDVRPIGEQVVQFYQGGNVLIDKDFSGAIGMPALLKAYYYTGIAHFIFLVLFLYVVLKGIYGLMVSNIPERMLLGYIASSTLVSTLYISGNFDRALSSVLITVFVMWVYLIVIRGAMLNR